MILLGCPKRDFADVVTPRKRLTELQIEFFLVVSHWELIVFCKSIYGVSVIDEVEHTQNIGDHSRKILP
jgi:hypothetical protein